MKSAAASTNTTEAVPEGPLRFKLKAYAPRVTAPTPPREPALPQSIKDAIVRWLDEQL
ncbi:MAG TPA: hypothetical protein VFA20_05170 [Myxococcaceae bacterium]|nr:hypothetical protein [Myxococcaceae bacterium]